MLNENYYFENILGDDPSSFINIFKNSWDKHITSFPKKYINAEQFIIGARLRPVMVCWGYVLSESTFDNSTKTKLSQLSLYIELLHKSTLLIDDLIDNDSSRHGKKTFHVQFSDNEAILFALYLVADSFEQLSKSLKNSKIRDNPFDIALNFSQTIKEMTFGALQEVNLDRNGFTSIKLIKEIIENQTISIIKNGLLTGFKFGNGNYQLLEVVDSIGYDCGYIFQLLNDLEPFGSTKINIEHKGRSNIDVIRSRKNLTVAFIFNSLKKKDQVLFQNLIQNEDFNEDEILKKVFQYFQENNVIELILDNLSDVRHNIDANIIELKKKIQNEILLSNFSKFINYILKEAIKRVGNENYNKLFEILIK